MATRKLEVQIIGDSRSLERAFARSQRSAQEFQTGVTRNVAKVGSSFDRLQRLRTGAFVGGAGAGVAIVAVKRLTNAASDLNEQMSKTQQVFGSSSQSVIQWSHSTSSAMGIAQTDALAAASTFGNLFSAIGIIGPKASELSRRLVQLAADLASFNNASPEDTLDAIRSGLIGEAEPLRRYGVLLSETRVQQVALADTGKTVASSLTDQEKAAARVKIIFQDTSKAQGDFARTSGSLANQQRILQARLKDTEAELGRNLLPLMIKFTEVANTVVGSFTNMTDASLLFSQNFRNNLVDAFGEQFLRQTLAKAGPALEQAMKDFEATLDPFKLHVPVEITPTVAPQDFAKQAGVHYGPAIAESFGAAVAQFQNVARAQIDAAIAAGRAATTKAEKEEAARRKRDAIAKAQELAREQADIRRRALEIAQRQQFRAIGLAPTGQELVPTAANLKKQFATLSQRVIGEDVPKNLRDRLRKVGKYLAGDIKGITEETRRAILDLFETIRGTFDSESKKGPLTKTTSFRLGDVLGGVTGLDAAQLRQIRANLSNFNSAGVGLAAATSPVNVTSETTIRLDSDVVARAVTRQQQKGRRRNPPQKRGPNRGGV